MNSSHLPTHVAIIMDGNGRWAKAQGLSRNEGHQAGVITSENIIMEANDLGLQYLTLYAFSRENWNRPAAEVHALMQLLKAFLEAKRKKMLDRGIRLNAIGDLKMLPQDVRATLDSVIADTSKGCGMILTLALSYGSRDEIMRAVRDLVKKTVETGASHETITEGEFSQILDTRSIPDPDLIIRTSGERRISNFLLWQGAYAEFIFEECNWPDFTKEHLQKAFQEYQQRERRFGKTSEQITGGRL